MKPFLATQYRIIYASLIILLCFLGKAESETMQMEEVIVTAEKRVENLQELSQAVSVFDGYDLNDLSVTRLVDMNALAPGVNIAKNEGFKTVITVRGVGNEANQNSIASPSVSFHIDGIYIASAFSLQTDLVDVERIEFVRGPQGTVFGQNSTGGAVNLVTVAPSTQNRTASVAVTVGDYNLIQTDFIADGPISERFAIRGVGSFKKHDGFSENLILDQPLDQNDSISAKLTLFWHVTPNFDVRLSRKHFVEDTGGAAQKSILDLTPGARELSHDSPSSYYLNAEVSSLIIEWRQPRFTWKYLTSLQQDAITVYRDNDRTSLRSIGLSTPLPAVVAPERDTQDTFTHEIQLISTPQKEDKNEWVAGFFALDSTFDVFFYELIDFGRDGIFGPVVREQVLNYELSDYGFISDSTIQRKSLSTYFQNTRHMTPKTKFIGGLRYTNDEVEGRVTNFFGRAGTDLLTISSNRLSGRLTLERDFENNTIFYATLAQGFKPGGSNLTYGRENEIAPILVRSTYEDEVVNVFEIGLKTDIIQHRLRSNVAVFTYDYKNLQYQATDPEVFEGGVANIPESTIRGLELEVSAILTDNITVDTNFAWLNTNVSSTHRALDNVASDATTNSLLSQGFSLFGPEIQRARAEEIQDVQGNQLAKAPEFTANFSIGYRDNYGSWGEIRGKFSVVYRGEYYHRLFNNPVTDFVESYTTLNITASFQPYVGSWSAVLRLLNATNEPGINSRFTDVFGVGATSDELIPPRQILLSVRMEFS